MTIKANPFSYLPIPRVNISAFFSGITAFNKDAISTPAEKLEQFILTRIKCNALGAGQASRARGSCADSR